MKNRIYLGKDKNRPWSRHRQKYAKSKRCAIR